MKEWTALIFLFFPCRLHLKCHLANLSFLHDKISKFHRLSIILDKYIITSDFFNEEVVDGKRIRYVPLWYWLLEENGDR
ncbi:hypothetical protein MM_2678 [Methanosarcina mazei Go1]|uniref:Uncharacterized protein n=1 Tax=Methanosarcina mazei (strain ATCC BAA-159 / DSM 3647 / Goe1 / Go1 / JCM 11833 / OCM 88) TaxID=192952 RepID=Q8PTN5_METMA|nr:hypothetical protein MM_2678 [Methanosarcina mazei Go1]